ncbi:MAG: 1-deoxy-D-xylulose-5-phosphate reductoisomerase [Candidatus Eremiobacteraeota bacterium]|nr:1-deoxy-D-xylulose-5-phosphate reductoisomerase [Candidatus Eremiobacteraeota bacterium]MBV8365812.1 1-deoxy-D-xylulose-5-phosphate reductoisomerase [Candidatus Eremiobacteraeota bacterium]
MKRVSILGSTGSIGTQALDVVSAHPGEFQVTALAARANVARLAEQANRFKPSVLSIGSPELMEPLFAALRYEPRSIGHGIAGLRQAAGPPADVVLAATDGMAALEAVTDAIDRGITVALANKELAVAAGEALFARAHASGARIMPVDSEHSAVFQCLLGERKIDIARIVLTASGGPLADLALEQMRDVTPAQALAHPTWAMGAKNSLDSATMMNKGLEAIEASRFFDLAPEQIEIVIHRQSVAHAFVIFRDGSVKAQLAAPDMRLPIGYALSYPQRLGGADTAATRAALALDGAPARLTFEPVDERRFPAVALCYRALRAGGTHPAVLSAANEEAGRAFLQGKIKYPDISALVERALEAHAPNPATLDAVRIADAWARATTLAAIDKGKNALSTP